MLPTVIENEGRVERRYDIYSLLLKERIVFLGTPINDQIANLIVAQLLYLNREDPEREIQLFVNSPGGAAYAGMAILDTIRQITAPVSTVAVGLTASFGTIILAAGEAGRRYALPHATVHMHQPLLSGGMQGQATDIQIQADEIMRLRDRVDAILAEATGQPQDKIREDTERDKYFSAQEAADYGLIDGVLDPAKANVPVE